LLSNSEEDAMDEPGSDFRRELEARGVSRREFMGFCSEQTQANIGVAQFPRLRGEHRIVPSR
jgi:hypothetical protein